VDNAVNSADHKPLVAVVKAAASWTRSRARGFTVFAPTKSAFSALPDLLKPESRAALAKVLTYQWQSAAIQRRPAWDISNLRRRSDP